MLVKNNGSTPVSVVLPAAPGQFIQQVMQVVCGPDVGGQLNGRAFLLNEVASSGSGAYIWFNVGGQGFDPGPIAGRTGVEVDVALNASAATIASAINTAIAAHLAGRFSSVIVASVDVNITNVVGGVVPGSSNVNSVDQGTGFGFSILTLGAEQYNYSWAPLQVLQFNDSLATSIQAACLLNPSLEIIIPGAALNCSFIVDATNGNGLGIRSLKSSQGFSKVYGHSTVPVVGNSVPAGFVQIFFTEAFTQYFGGFAGPVAPTTGSNVTAGSFVIGKAYVITSLGNTNWHSIGVPSNITPVIGVAFFATGIGAGTGVAQLPSVSGIDSIEVVGDPNQTINAVGGGYIILQYIAPTISTGAYIAPMIPTQPADNTVIGATFYLG